MARTCHLNLPEQILELKPGDHICLMYDEDPAEQFPALVPFIQDGLERNEQFIYIADDQTVEQLAEGLRERGIPVDREMERGALKLWSRSEWRQPGELSSEKKAQQVREMCSAAMSEGFAGVRFAVEMTWTLGPDIPAEALEHWEATLNTIFVPGFPGRIVCQYNRARLSPETLLAGMHTHPLTVIGDEIHPNAFYRAPMILEGRGNFRNPGVDSEKLEERLEWMILQLQKTRGAEKDRAERLQRKLTESGDTERALRDRTRSLEIINRVGITLAAELDLEKLLQAVTDAGREVSQAAFGAFFYNTKNAAGEGYMLYTLSGAPREAFAGFPTPRNTDLFAPTFRGEGVIRIADVLKDPRYGSNSPNFGMPKGHLPVRSYLAAPVISRSGDVLGGLFFGHPEPGVFSEEVERMITAIAAQAAIAIDNANLYGELQRELEAHKKAEAALRDSERLFRQLADSMPQMVWTARPDGYVDYFNKRWYDYTGFPERFGDEGWTPLLHPEDVQRSLDAWYRSVRSGRSYEVESRLKDRQTSGYRWFLNRALPIRDAQGKIVRWFGTSTDIDDQKRSEAELTQLKDRLALELADTKRLHRVSSRLLNETELIPPLQDILEACVELTGTTKGNVQLYDEGEGVLRIVAHVGFTQEFVDQFKVVTLGYSVCGKALAKRERVIMENAATDPRFAELAPVYAKFGFVAVQSTPLLGSDGRFLGMLSTHYANPHRPSDRELQLLDLFAQQAARLIERKQSEEISRRLFDLVAAVNRAGVLSQVYDAALDAICRCYSVKRASILLYDADGIMRFKAWRGLSDGYRRAVEGHSPWKAGETNPQPVCLGNLEEVELDTHLREVINAEGIKSLAFIPITNDKRLLGKFMIYRDAPHVFTDKEVGLARTIASQIAFAVERHQSGEALERLVSERTAQLRDTVAELEAFSYSIAHDMRAPLRAMIGFSHLLEEEFAPMLPDDGRHYTRRIASSAERLDRLILDVLNYSKLARGEMPVEVVEIEKLIREIVDSYLHLQEGGATILIQSPMPAVIGNPAALTQCISNLLSNAVKFVAPDSKAKVQVWTETKEDWVRLWFEDNGIGISPEGQKRIFLMFQRLNPAKDFEGTGIGLTIVRKAVERMGGRIGVESTVGAGSRFWIELKRATELR